MNTKKIELAPTLWRTCRAMNNLNRLRLMRLVFKFRGEFYVRQFAKVADLTDSQASSALRQLNARGLIGVRRDSIKVYYDLQKDRSLPDSIAIQNAFSDYFDSDLKVGWEKEVMRILKGFAHFNRLAMLIRLSEGPSSSEELAEAMGVCVKSFYHHFRYLKHAGLAIEERNCRAPSVFHLIRPDHPIAKVLLKVLLSGVKHGIVYFNPGSGRETPAKFKNIKCANVSKFRDRAKFSVIDLLESSVYIRRTGR